MAQCIIVFWWMHGTVHHCVLVDAWHSSPLCLGGCMAQCIIVFWWMQGIVHHYALVGACTLYNGGCMA